MARFNRRRMEINKGKVGREKQDSLEDLPIQKLEELLEHHQSSLGSGYAKLTKGRRETIKRLKRILKQRKQREGS